MTRLFAFSIILYAIGGKMISYYDEARQDLYDELHKLDKFARGIGKTLKTVAKFFLILFLYLSLNAVVAVLTNQTRSISPSIFNLVQESLRTFIQQNILILLACENTFQIYYTFSIAVAFGVGITALVLAMCKIFACVKKSNVAVSSCRKLFLSEKFAAVAVSYKQHVSFLS